MEYQTIDICDIRPSVLREIQR